MKGNETTIGGVNFTKDVAKKITRSHFDNIMKKFKSEVRDQKWKMLCDFAGRKEKASPKHTSKRKKTSEDV